MELCVVVIAHGRSQDTFNRHEKFWLAHKAPLIVVCPENDPISSQHETLKLFKAEHSGESATQRLRAIFEMLSTRKWERCLIFEYDSFFLDPNITSNMGLHGIYFDNKESRFIAHRYPNPPWLFDRHSFGLMVNKMREYPSISELGFADRFIAALAYLSGVPMLEFDPPGFSASTILELHLPFLREQIHRGCKIVHGVKDAATLSKTLAYYEESLDTF
jgi:hypothetical protein